MLNIKRLQHRKPLHNMRRNEY